MKKIFYNILIFIIFIIIPIFSQVTPESILKDMNQKWSNIKDFQMRLSIISYSYSSKGDAISQKITMDMFYISQPQIIRIEFIEPALFSGQIILLDYEKKIMRMYMPSTKQIIESDLTQTETYTMGVNIPFVSGKEEDFTLELTEMTEKNEKIYKLTGKPNTPELKTTLSYFEFFISKNDLKPLRVKIYDLEKRLYMDIIWVELKTNQNLSINKLRTLPQGKIIKQKTPQTTTPLPFFAPGK